jgi:small subunit ribosomal protein S3Ae
MSRKGRKEKKAQKKQEKKKRVIKKTPTVDKWKKKKWYTIFASPEFDKKEIGKTPAEKPGLVSGRIVKASLGLLTNQRQKRHITVTFMVNDVQGDNAYTIISGHFITPSYINRMVRRRNSKMETVQTASTADKKKLKIKAVTISSKKLDAEQETTIRKMMVKEIAQTIKKKDFNQAIQETIFGVVAAKVFKQAKKIAQLKRVEIVKSQIVE